MNYEVKGKILGFDDTKKVKMEKVDDLFYTLVDENNQNISFTLVNPYELREYSFDITPETKDLLDIKEDSKLSVYNLVVIQEPINESVINFLAPIIINHDNNTIGQTVLDPERHEDCGLAQPISSFKK